MNATLFGGLLGKFLSFAGTKAEGNPRLTGYVGLGTGILGIFGVAPGTIKTTLVEIANAITAIANLIPG